MAVYPQTTSNPGIEFALDGTPPSGPTATANGEWDASTGILPVDPDIGDIWHVSVAGSAGGTDYEVDDVIMWFGSYWYIFRKVFGDGEAPLNIGSLAARPATPTANDFWILKPTSGPDNGKTFVEWYDGTDIFSIELTAV